MCDSDLVNDTLIPTIESYGFRCCVHWRDFSPGRVYADNIVESVYNSFKIIAVVSRHFINSQCCDFELQHTINRLMNCGDDCLIVIKFDDIGVESLPPSILDRSYIDFTQQTDRDTWESKLAEILRRGVVEDDNNSSNSTINTNNNNRLSDISSTDSEGRTLVVAV